MTTLNSNGQVQVIVLSFSEPQFFTASWLIDFFLTTMHHNVLPFIFLFPVILSINYVNFMSEGIIISRAPSPNFGSAVSIIFPKQVLVLRGGFAPRTFKSRPRRRLDLKAKSRIIKRMKVKLSQINSRKSKLAEYEKRYLSDNISTVEGRSVDPDAQGANNASFAHNASAVSGSVTTKRGIESILKELNQTGLCRIEELDAKVHAFIARLKKSGRRTLVLSALAR